MGGGVMVFAASAVIFLRQIAGRLSTTLKSTKSLQCSVDNNDLVIFDIISIVLG